MSMPRVKTIISTKMFLLPLLLPFGCAWHQPIAVPVKPTETYMVRAETGALSAAAEPFDTDDKAQIFGEQQSGARI